MATPVHARYALLAAVLLMPAVACELLVSSDVFQCSSDGDCAARGAQFAGTQCLSHVCVGDAGAVDTGTLETGSEGAVDAGTDGPNGCIGQVDENPLVHVTYTRVFQDVTAGAPLTNIGVRVCSIIDKECNFPRAQDGGPGRGAGRGRPMSTRSPAPSRVPCASPWRSV